MFTSQRPVKAIGSSAPNLGDLPEDNLKRSGRNGGKRWKKSILIKQYNFA